MPPEDQAETLRLCYRRLAFTEFTRRHENPFKKAALWAVLVICYDFSSGQEPQRRVRQDQLPARRPRLPVPGTDFINLHFG
jgi:hypothetical protein